MNEFAKTGAALAAAVAVTALAVSMKPGEVRLDLFDDQGEVFFPAFTDGDAINELEVTAFRESSSDIYAFAVKRDDDAVWRIPSHGNYPADANDQMGKAASMLIGLKKDAVVGDAKGRHAEYGLVDPLAEGVETEGRGKRLKLKDKAGNVLADLIVGDEVEGKAGTFYCRLPGKKRIYKTKLQGALSTQFADWIETDLLKAQSWNVNKIVFDNYAVDEQKGQIVKGDRLVLEKGDDNKFAFVGLDAATEVTNVEKATEIGNTLGEIKIVGVRPKPEGLTARLERANGFEAQVLRQQLQSKGFFLAGGKLVSNEGDLIFETKSGVRYTLRFGELVYGEGDEVTSGIGSDEGAAADKKPAANNRYLMVTAEFVEALLDKPEGARLEQAELDKRRQARTTVEAIVAAIKAFKLANEGALPADLAALAQKPAEGEPLLKELVPDPWGNDFQFTQEGDAFFVMSFGADGKPGGDGPAKDVSSAALADEDAIDEAASAWTAYDGQVTTGQEEADQLTKRFGPWYYVIDKALFEKLKPQRVDLVKPKPADAGDGAGAGGK
ncbi:MAG: DUF4340 domain-containing protein [Planctomycetota bacterium]|nr:DUF4340 domain-containing protein [Planctomycetota bacterium]